MNRFGYVDWMLVSFIDNAKNRQKSSKLARYIKTEKRSDAPTKEEF